MDDASVRELVLSAYAAYPARDRGAIEAALSEDFTFSSPDDPELDREGYFERCWPNSGHMAGFEFEQLFVDGEDVLIRYTATRSDGSRFRNCEYMHVADGRITRTEVYYGIDLPNGS